MALADVMDSSGTVGDVTFATGSVQTVRQVRKVLVSESDASSSDESQLEIVQSNVDGERERETQLDVRELLVALRGSLDASSTAL